MSVGSYVQEDPTERAKLLTALYMAEQQYGYLTPEAIERVAERLHMKPGQVYWTATFYSMYHTEPKGRYVIQVCEGLSCHLADGAERLVRQIEDKLGIEVDETTADGSFTLKTVECLAACGSGPTMRINDTLYTQVTPDKLGRILAELGG